MSQKVKQFDELDRHMQEHLTALKVHNVDEYFKWCVKNGFKRTLNKGWQQCATEDVVKNLIENDGYYECQFNKMFKGCRVNVIQNRKLRLRSIYDKNGTEVSCVTDEDCGYTEVV